MSRAAGTPACSASPFILSSGRKARRTATTSTSFTATRPTAAKRTGPTAASRASPGRGIRTPSTPRANSSSSTSTTATTGTPAAECSSATMVFFISPSGTKAARTMPSASGNGATGASSPGSSASTWTRTPRARTPSAASQAIPKPHPPAGPLPSPRVTSFRTTIPGQVPTAANSRNSGSSAPARPTA